MGAHRGELGGASLVRFLAESIVGYLGGKGGGNSFVPPPNISRFPSGGGASGLRVAIMKFIPMENDVCPPFPEPELRHRLEFWFSLTPEMSMAREVCEWYLSNGIIFDLCLCIH